MFYITCKYYLSSHRDRDNLDYPCFSHTNKPYCKITEYYYKIGCVTLVFLIQNDNSNKMAVPHLCLHHSSYCYR